MKPNATRQTGQAAFDGVQVVWSDCGTTLRETRQTGTPPLSIDGSLRHWNGTGYVHTLRPRYTSRQTLLTMRSAERLQAQETEAFSQNFARGLLTLQLQKVRNVLP